MRSIRRSLILNVFVLLAVALGAVCVLVYHTTERNLLAKQDEAKRLISIQFDDQRDEALANQALTLARMAHSQVEPGRPRPGVLPHTLLVAAYRGQSKAPLYLTAAAWTGALVGITPGPSRAAAALPVWLANDWRHDWWVAGWLRNLLATDIAVDEEALGREPEAEKHEFLQINSEWGSVWRSHSLGGMSLPVERDAFDAQPGYQRRFDDVEVMPGVKARRVQVKSTLTRFRSPIFPPVPRYDRESTARGALGSALTLFGETPRPPSPGRRGPPPVPVPLSSRTVDPPSENTPFRESRFLDIYVQCAWSTDPSHPFLQELTARRDHQVRDLEQETAATLRNLSARLLWIGLITAGVVLLGGWLLVGVGLAPLDRLSVAVSQISPKDFRLPVAPEELPREAVPIVDRLNDTLAQLQNAFEREKRAAADISHELRTPVAALMTTLEVTLKKQRSAEQYRESLEDCRAIGKQMSQLIERMLMLAWLDAGADQVRPQQVEVGQLVEGCSAVSKPLAEAQGLAFRVRLDAPVSLRTDPDKLREVMMNLLHNAIEYNRPGGEVELAARPRDAGGVVFEVNDTGIGIPPDMQDKIFERFYRGDPSRNGTGVHAGLGLSIVKEYVDRLGGKLTVDSAVGRGSRFRVELPNLS